MKLPYCIMMVWCKSIYLIDYTEVVKVGYVYLLFVIGLSDSTKKLVEEINCRSLRTRRHVFVFLATVVGFVKAFLIDVVSFD